MRTKTMIAWTVVALLCGGIDGNASAAEGRVDYGVGGTWKVNVVKAGGVIASLGEADALLTSEPGVRSEAVAVDFSDNSPGRFGVDLPFPTGGLGLDNFAMRVTGHFEIAKAGTLTLGFTSDDGGRLRVDGADVATFPGLRGADVSLGTVELAAGKHSVELTMFEKEGNAAVELFAARHYGTLTKADFSVAGFELLKPVPAPGEEGRTLVVSNTDDSGPGSLGWAIDQVNGSSSAKVHRIDLTGVEGVINVWRRSVPSGGRTPYPVWKPVVIEGNPARPVTISGAGESRVFEVNTSGVVTLKGLTIADGVSEGVTRQGGFGGGAGMGGGIFVEGGRVVLDDVRLVGNRAAGGDGTVRDAAWDENNRAAAGTVPGIPGATGGTGSNGADGVDAPIPQRGKSGGHGADGAKGAAGDRGNVVLNIFCAPLVNDPDYRNPTAGRRGGSGGAGGAGGAGGNGSFRFGGAAGGHGGNGGGKGAGGDGVSAYTIGPLLPFGCTYEVAGTNAGPQGSSVGAQGTAGRGGNGGFGGGAGPAGEGANPVEGTPGMFGGKSGSGQGGGGAGLGGGVFVKGGATLTVWDAYFRGNRAAGGGGNAGVSGSGGQGKGGGLFAMDGASVEVVTFPAFDRNEASNHEMKDGDNAELYGVKYPFQGYRSLGESLRALEMAFGYEQNLYGGTADFTRVDDGFIGKGSEYTAGEELETVEQQLASDPNNPYWRALWLDVHYAFARAYSISVKNDLGEIRKDARFRPVNQETPMVLVIGDEIMRYETVAAKNREAFGWLFSILNKNLGFPGRVMGADVFCELVPGNVQRGRNDFLFRDERRESAGTPLFDGYRDLVLLFEILRTDARIALELARLYRQNLHHPTTPTTLEALRKHVATSRFEIGMYFEILLGLFPGYAAPEGSDADVIVAGIEQALVDLAAVGEGASEGVNALGFSADFLMLASNRGEHFDSYDNFMDVIENGQIRLGAEKALEEAREAIDTTRYNEADMRAEWRRIAEPIRQRLYEVVGVYPGEPGYETPEKNVTGAIWQQLESIRAARLRAEQNTATINNLKQEVRIEIERRGAEIGIRNAISGVRVRYIDHAADLSEEIGHLAAGQLAVNEIVDGLTADALTKSTAAVALVNSTLQVYLHERQLELEVQKERLAAAEQVEITALENQLITVESEAYIKTRLLEMNVLLLESQEAAVLVGQEVAQLVALYCEVADLERRLAEADEDLATRYYSDPVHRLREAGAALEANLAFERYQRWLYFAARALEYKWNEPFRPSVDWSTETLFLMRNADELGRFRRELVDFDKLKSANVPREERLDLLSFRDDVFGAGSGEDRTVVFQERLRELMNVNGDIVIPFSTVRELPNSSFFKGPRYLADGSLNPLQKGDYLDKISWLHIRLPGHHSTNAGTFGEQLTGSIGYSGVSFVRRAAAGNIHNDRRDRVKDELTAYATRFLSPTSQPNRPGQWEFESVLSDSGVKMLKSKPDDPPLTMSDVLLPIYQIDVFKERSVAASEWTLVIPTRAGGAEILKIDELEDIELFIRHEVAPR